MGRHRAAPTSDAGRQTQAEFEDDYQQQLDSGQLAVLDADGNLVGWMDPNVYYAGAQDPLIIEVRAHDTEEIIGYRVRHVGFVPEALLNGDGSLEDIVMELYGEEQAAGALRQEEFRTFVDSFGPGELAQAIDEHTGG